MSAVWQLRRPAVVLALAAALIDAWACYALAGLTGARNDLFPRWLATRLWLASAQDLYSPATDGAIRAAMGTPPLGGDHFVFGFVYPAYVALLLAPLAVLPLRVAATAWLLLVQASVVGGTLLAWRAHERERGLPPARPLAALVTAVLLPATTFNLIFLQFAAPVFFALAASWWLLTRGHDRASGIALLPALVKPPLAALPIFALFVHAAAAGRWRFLLSATVAGTALFCASLVVVPAWPVRFMRSTQAYAAATRPQSAATLVASFGSTSSVVAALLLVCVAVFVLWAWWVSPRALGDGLASASLLSLWLVPPLYEWNSVMLLLVLVPALRGLRVRGVAPPWLACGAAIAASALTAWAYTRWPSESRVIWPLFALAIYVAGAARRVGIQSVTSSTPSPSLAVRV
ncbi:MAG: glycosyltransferase 87 family protein [Chloroflexota bacterium]